MRPLLRLSFLWLPAVAAVSQAKESVHWQRCLPDALAEQARTGMPLLIAVNTQGEVFNDRFAQSVYPSAEFIALTRGFVCVVASPDRHNERDYDYLGNRIECPKFPGCTCAEHIQIEPLLYERWFDGNRTAPRHVAVSTDGKKLFDRFLDRSMQTAIDAIRKAGGDAGTAWQVPDATSARWAIHGAHARRALEAEFRAASAQGRIALLAEAGKASTGPIDLLRMGLRDPEERVFAAAAEALAMTATAEHAIDIEDALARAEAGSSARSKLLARAAALAPHSPALARLEAHVRDLAEVAFPQPWRNPWRSAAFAGADRASIETELDRCEAALRKNPNDDLERLALATAQAALGIWLVENSGKGVELWLSDAERNASKVKATELDPEAAALTAVAAWHRGDAATAGAAALRMHSRTASARQPDAWLGGKALAVAARLVSQRAFAKISEDPNASLLGELPQTSQLLAELAKHQVADPTTELLLLAIYEAAGRRAEARAAMARIVAQHPSSAAAHERWRARLLIDRGVDAMMLAYWQFAKQTQDQATAHWFLGYAAVVAGETCTQDQRPTVALAYYGEAIASFARSSETNADYADSAKHFTVLALAGRAELLAAQQQFEAAAKDLLDASALRPESLDADDGLQRKPRGIAARVERLARDAGQVELADRLKPILP